MALSVKRVATASRRGRYRDERGLYLQVHKGGSKAWVLRYQFRGTERWLGLGPVADFTLEEARERARLARQRLKDGVDPLAERDAEKAKGVVAAAREATFKEVARQFYDAKAGGWRNAKHRAQFLSTLETYAYPHFGSLPVSSVDTPLVLKALEPIWRTKTETASRVRSRIEAVLSFAKVKELRTGDNPAQWVNNLEHILPSPSKVKAHASERHFAAMPFDAVPAFFVRLADAEGLAVRALALTILTAARTGEIVGARWDEIDWDAAVWTVPAARMKMQREHRVPLSQPALTILRELPREVGSDFIFPGDRAGQPLSNMAMLMAMRRMEEGEFTVHGFRSAFRDWAAERTATPNHIVEMALAHSIGSKVEEAYRRGDLLAKRAKLMGDWARFVTTVRPAGASVTPISDARRSAKG